MGIRVFICYRRQDSAGHAGRVHDHLEREFGPDVLFIDVDAIRLGTNFVKVIGEEVAKCDALLAIIGPGWLDARDEESRRRLDDQNDFVRVEIAAALKRDIPVIPILLEGARMPKADRLPEDLRDLVSRSALDVRHASFRTDIERLIRDLKSLGRAEALRTTAPEPPATLALGEASPARPPQQGPGTRRQPVESEAPEPSLPANFVKGPARAVRSTSAKETRSKSETAARSNRVTSFENENVRFGEPEPPEDAASHSEIAPQILFSYAPEDARWVELFRHYFRIEAAVISEVEAHEPPFGRLKKALSEKREGFAAVLAFVSQHYRNEQWSVAEWERGLSEAERGRLILVPVLLD